jgi:phage tail-like protein
MAPGPEKNAEARATVQLAAATAAGLIRNRSTPISYKFLTAFWRPDQSIAATIGYAAAAAVAEAAGEMWAFLERSIRSLDGDNVVASDKTGKKVVKRTYYLLPEDVSEDPEILKEETDEPVDLDHTEVGSREVGDHEETTSEILATFDGTSTIDPTAPANDLIKEMVKVLFAAQYASNGWAADDFTLTWAYASGALTVTATHSTDSSKTGSKVRKVKKREFVKEETSSITVAQEGSTTTQEKSGLSMMDDWTATARGLLTEAPRLVGEFQKVDYQGKLSNAEGFYELGTDGPRPMMVTTDYYGVTLSMGNMDQKWLWDWMEEVTWCGNGKHPFRRDGIIIHFDRTGFAPLRIIRVIKAFPTSWKGPPLDATSEGTVPVDQIELTCEKVDIIHIGLGSALTAAKKAL